jgi:hypothetical protein
MRLHSLWINIIFLITCITSVHAYNNLTHSKISKEAYNTSILSTGYLDNIGISQDDKFDISNISKNGKLIENGEPINVGTLLGWLREGSVDEDDYTIIPLFLRFNNHFYNPIDGSGLHFGIITGYPAPSWGLEDDATYSEQLYSIKDARDYFYKGLTMTTKTNREQNIALTFRTLGQVIHLIEDMDQPQHTRNDPHGGLFGLKWGPQILGQKSRYEEYVEINYSTFEYSGYSAVSFDNYRSYFVTSNGKGISQFSNRNFVSHGTNFTKLEQGNSAPGFPDPKLDLNKASDETIQTTDMYGNPVTGVMTFFGNTIVDIYTGDTSTQNDKMTTFSLLDQDLIKRDKPPTFTLNDRNYYTAANILLKRAVGYSAGLLNYFFRGNIEMIPDETGSGYVIVNNTGEKMEGDFTIYCDTMKDERFPVWAGRGTLEAAIGDKTKECPYCLSAIPIKAIRCAHCTSELKGS